ncbi:alpha/beta hydrolase [Bradyrhizobium sp. dw_78]|uniref:alpha/beta hydrolase n=1 Tax=Bradyrhizobium sp. dw_78 TaxID=2719793 RepID=UPI001BD62B1C|nr:alpha/beta hydrolase [Bradyrhizobium sp. dw_78]
MAAKTVILTHGAWADGSSWSEVIPSLRAHGLNTTAVQMPLSGFKADVATLCRAIAAAEPPVVLAGHSYGGAVITEAGTNAKVSALVYVAAFAPDAGESADLLGKKMEPPPMATEIRPCGDGYLTLTQAGVHQDFAQDLPEPERDILFAAQGPTAIASLTGTVSRPAWREKPSWYLVAGEDRAIQPALERSMAERVGATVTEIAASHLVMLSHPDAVAELILQAANAALPRQ